MDNETVKKILELAVLAPSGDNCQPWRFEYKDGKLLIFSTPEKDISTASAYVSNGALLENLLIVAPSFGWSAAYHSPSNFGENHLVAEVEFKKIPPFTDPLFDAVPLRASNRKPYELKPVDEKVMAEILACQGKIKGGEIFLVSEKEEKEKAAKILSGNIEILFGVKKLHSFFYNQINWTKEDDVLRKAGFPIGTLEIPKEVLSVFKLLGSWRAARILGVLGVPSAVARTNAKIFSQAGAFGVIVFPESDPASLLEAGRLFERIWLTSTLRGLQFQAFGISSLLLELERTPEIFPEKCRLLMERMDLDTAEVFGVKSGRIMMAFRIGEGEQPSEKTRRSAPEIIF